MGECRCKRHWRGILFGYGGKIRLMAMKIFKRGMPRERRIREKRQHSQVNGRVLVYSFIVTLILYAVMLFIERTVIQSDEYTMVYVAQANIDENTMLTADNVGLYFAAEERRSDWLPDNCVTDMTQLLDMITVRSIRKNEIITGDLLSSQDGRIEGIDSPVEVSINASNLSQVVGGVLREGDRINIWSVTELNNNGVSVVEAEKICDYAYVTRVFTAAGVQVKRNPQDEGSAMVVNIIIPGKKEEEFNVALEKGTLRIGRCMYEREGAVYGYKGGSD